MNSLVTDLATRSQGHSMSNHPDHKTVISPIFVKFIPVVNIVEI